MRRSLVALVVVLIALSTFFVASAMMGALALVSGAATGIGERVAYYLLGGAAVFTAVLIYLEIEIEDGLTILSVSVAIGIVGLLIIALGIEGVLFGLENPDRMRSNLFVYLLAAGLISTGVVVWAVRHWREFARTHEIV